MNAKPRLETYEDVLAYQLTVLVEKFQKESGVPGIALAVATPDARVEVAAGVRSVVTRAPMDCGAHFHIGCIAKLLLSIVTLELARDGELSLNAPISDTLRELAGTLQGREVALVHLLSHTAGYRAFPLVDRATMGLTWDDFVGKLIDGPQLFTPGTIFSYEHTGAALIGELVQRTTDRLVAEHLARLCAALQVEPIVLTGNGSAPNHSGQHYFDFQARKYRLVEGPPPAAETQGASMAFWRPSFSNLALSVRDLARIGAALCGNAEGAFEEPVLSASTRGLLQRSVVTLPPFLTPIGAQMEFPEGFSLGAAQFSGGWHGLSAIGIGHCTELRFHPGQQAVVAMGVNANYPALSQQLVRMAGMIALRQNMTPTTPHQPSDLVACDLEGQYVNGGSISGDVRLESGNLACRFQAATPSPPIQVNINLDAEPVRLTSNFPGVAIAFLKSTRKRTADGLMYGLSAYKRIQ